MNVPTVGFPEPYPDTMLTGELEGGRPVWTLQVAFRFVAADRYHGVVPAGFRFDFASVPRAFWRIFPPIHPRYAGAALLHDWVYASEWWDKVYCDRLFLGAMIGTGVSWWRRNAMWAAVAAFGGSTWRAHTRESVMGARRLSGVSTIRRPLYQMT